MMLRYSSTALCWQDSWAKQSRNDPAQEKLVFSWRLWSHWSREISRLQRSSQRSFIVRPHLEGPFLIAMRRGGSVTIKVSGQAGHYISGLKRWWRLVFTVNLHLFGILLACKDHNATLSAGGIEIGDVRSSLDYGLKTLKAVERTSLMSRKAGHCLKGFLRIFDSLSKWMHRMSMYGIFPYTMSTRGWHMNLLFYSFRPAVHGRKFSQYAGQRIYGISSFRLVWILSRFDAGEFFLPICCTVGGRFSFSV